MRYDFYKQLQSKVVVTIKHNVFMVMEYLNAEVGKKNIKIEESIGKYGLGEVNETIGLFVDFDCLNSPIIGG